MVKRDWIINGGLWLLVVLVAIVIVLLVQIGGM